MKRPGGIALAGILAPLSLAASCQEPLEIILPLPPVDANARSVIVGLEHNDALVEVHAFDLPASEAFVAKALDWHPGDHLTVHALAYDQPLDHLQLQPGALEYLASGESLPENEQSLFSADVSDAGASPWRNVTGRPPPVDRFKTTFSSACPTFLAESGLLQATAKASLAVQLDNDSILVGTYDHEFYRVTRDSAEPLALPSSLPSMTAFRAEDGELWLAGQLGRVCRGRVDPEAQFFCLPYISGYDTIRAIAGPTTGPVDELFVLQENGGLHQWTLSGGWSHLTDFPFPDDRGQLAWIGPGRVRIAGGQMVRAAYEVDQGQLKDLMLETNGDGVTGIAHNPAVGTLVGTTLGSVFLEVDDQWRSVSSPFQVGVSEIIPFEGGFAVAGTRGLAAVLLPQEGFCASYHPTPSFITALVALGQDLFMLGNDKSGDGFGEVSLLRRAR